MEFASTHVYIYSDDSEEECVSDEELEEGIDLSTLDDTISNKDTTLISRAGAPAVDSVPSSEVRPPPVASTGTLFSLPVTSGGFGGTSSTNTAGFGHFHSQASGFGTQALRYDAGTTASTGSLFAQPVAPNSGFQFGSHALSVPSADVADSTAPPSGTRSYSAALPAPKAKARKVHHWQSDAGGFRTKTSVEHPLRTHGKKYRRADPNVVSVKFDTLKTPSNMHAGDPEKCRNCEVVLSRVSKMTLEGTEQVWKCEFCSHRNIVDLVPEEIPSTSDVTYMLQPAPVTMATSLSGTDESLVIFCVDISGSMCVTTEVPGKIKLRGPDRLRNLQSFNDTRESQYLPSQRRNVTYISRLQAVQAAVDHQLSQMEKDHPNRRVALVTFNSEVCIVGDGTEAPITIAGDRLINRQNLIETGTQLCSLKSVKETRATLADKLFDLDEAGQTALGPAVTVSIAMASQHPGSKVILCTDGSANVGLGNLDSRQTEQGLEEAELFYSELAQMAIDKGVSVSIITIQGTDCGLLQLGKVASDTGGQVNVVDPLKLTEEFGNILANPVIATNVVAAFIVHQRLYIRHNAQDKQNKVTKEIGNVTATSECTFEYGVNNKVTNVPSTSGVQTDAVPENAHAQPMDTEDKHLNYPVQESQQETHAHAKAVRFSDDDLKELPFQLQITYTDRDGAKALRVITRLKPATTDREVAERDMNVGIITANTNQTSAQMALDGEYTQSRMNALMANRLVYRHAAKKPESKAAYKHFVSLVSPLENRLGQAQRQEKVSRGGTTYSDSESDEEEAVPSHRNYASVGSFGFQCKSSGYYTDGPPRRPTKSMSAAPKKKGKLTNRRKDTSDDVASVIYNAASSTSSVPPYKGKHHKQDKDPK